MAGDNKIKIGADTSAIKKSLMDLSKDVKELGKSKVAIFDKSQKDFLTKEAKKHMKDIGEQIANNNKRILATNKLLNTEGRTLKQNLKTRQALTNMMKKQVGLQKEMSKLGDMQTSLGGGGGKGLMGKMGGMLKGRGGMLGGLGGMTRMLGPLGLALGAGGLAVSRARKAHSTFESGVQGRLDLRGRGVGDMNLEDREGAAAAGLNSDTMRRTRMASMDVFGKAASTQQAVTQRSAFERNFGLERGTVGQLGQGVSETLGGADANKAMMTMQASLIASGITDEIGPYLETAATMLSTINEKGITFNDSAMGLLADLASQDGVAAERAGRLATGVDSAIRGSSGEANAFFQQVFADKGIGGKSLGGIQAAIRSGGLFGANTDADALVSDSDKKMFKRTGIGGQNMKNIASGTLGQLDKLFGSEEDNAGLNQEQQDNKRLQRLDFVRRTFGLQSEVEAANVEQLLQQAANGEKSEAQVKKELTKMQQGNTELGNLQLMNKTLEGQSTILKDIHQSILDEAGEQLGPLFHALDKTMMKLDATLSSLMSFFGITTDQQKVADAASGSDVVNADEYKKLTMGDKNLEKKFKGDTRSAYEANEKAIAEMGDTPFRSPRMDPYGHAQWEKKQKLLDKQQNFEETSKNLGFSLRPDKNMGTGQYVKQSQAPSLSQDPIKEMTSMFDGMFGKSSTPAQDNKELVSVMKEAVNLQQRSAKANETTAKNSKARGGAKNGTPRE